MVHAGRVSRPHPYLAKGSYGVQGSISIVLDPVPRTNPCSLPRLKSKSRRPWEARQDIGLHQVRLGLSPEQRCPLRVYYKFVSEKYLSSVYRVDYSL